MKRLLTPPSPTRQTDAKDENSGLLTSILPTEVREFGHLLCEIRTADSSTRTGCRAKGSSPDAKAEGYYSGSFGDERCIYRS